MSEYDDPADWADDLNRLASSVTPAPEAGRLVRAGIKRRQRRRAVVAVVGSAAAVAVVAGSAFALSRPTAGQEQGPAASSSPSAPALFTCPEDHRVFTDPVPPIADLAEQQTTIDSIEARSWEGFTIERTATSPLGVVAMIEGDLAGARSALAAVGVQIVYDWDPQLDGGGMGFVDWVIQWRLDAVVHELAEARRGIDGYAGVALWQDAGSVVLEWKAPIPPKIQALAGERPDRVTVIVRPAPYSSRDLSQALRRVRDAFEAGKIDARWSELNDCSDHSGLRIGVWFPAEDSGLGIDIAPSLSDERRAELQEQLSEVAGVPVMVTEQQPAVLL